jgi:CDP-paratose 2-epimerase
MTVDSSLHSLFGASKLAADILVQEYGRYFGLRTACFRAGCLTGPGHAGAELHGFLAYLAKCALESRPYTVYGYKAKQVRDNLHAHDLAEAFWQVFQAPRTGEIYNIGGGRESNCSMIEAITMVEALTGRPVRWALDETARTGDHIWWISDTRRFRSHYPSWSVTRPIPVILDEICGSLASAATAA